MLVFLDLGQNRYNLINCLEAMRPKHVVMYSADLASTREIEVLTVDQSNKWIFGI